MKTDLLASRNQFSYPGVLNFKTPEQLHDPQYFVEEKLSDLLQHFLVANLLQNIYLFLFNCSLDLVAAIPDNTV